jgi:hypothetical protein
MQHCSGFTKVIYEEITGATASLWESFDICESLNTIKRNAIDSIVAFDDDKEEIIQKSYLNKGGKICIT